MSNQDGVVPPKVSAIIPIYNTEKHLASCLDCVTRQTLEEIEIILVDDGSTDDSMAIAYSFAKKDPRIRIFHQDNKGAGSARNLGLSRAQGKYLSFLDSDDLFDPNMLEKAFYLCEETGADVGIYRTQQYFEETDTYKPANWTVKSELIPEKRTFLFSDIKENAFFAVLGYTWDKLIRRSLVDEINAHFQSQPVFNDSFFTYSVLLAAKRIAFLDEVLVSQRKRQSKDSISDRRAQYWTCSYTLLSELKNLLETSGLFARYEQDFINYAVHILLLDLDTKSGDNRTYMTEAIKRYWASNLGISKVINDRSFFYNANQWRQMRKLLYSPLRHSNIPALEDIAGPEVGINREKSGQVIVPIVFATDEGYAIPTVVALASLLERAWDTTTYEVHVLVAESFPTEAKKELKETCRSYSPRHTIDFIVPNSMYDEADIFISHITTATYYRLNLPSLLPDAERCIYLDSDVVIRGDLSELFLTDMANNYIAGVRAFTYFKDDRMIERKKFELGVDTWETYVNAGVLLMNLRLMRENNLESVFNSLLSRSFTAQDQDIINLACHGRTLLIPFKYNAMTKYNLYSDEIRDSTYLKDWVDKDDWDEGRLLPVIIHFADEKKPWNDASSLYAEAWWDVVKRLPDYLQIKILNKYIDNIVVNAQVASIRLEQLEKRQQRLLNYLSYWVENKASWLKRKLKLQSEE